MNKPRMIYKYLNKHSNVLAGNEGMNMKSMLTFRATKAHQLLSWIKDSRGTIRRDSGTV